MSIDNSSPHPSYFSSNPQNPSYGPTLSPTSSTGSSQLPSVFTPPVGSPITPMTPPAQTPTQFTIKRKSVQSTVQPSGTQNSTSNGSAFIAPGQQRPAAFCKHCSGGIGFNTEHLWCSHCNLHICMGCRVKHPSTHSSRLKRMTCRATPFGVIPMKRACAGCKKHGIGLYCTESGCAHATCYECMRDKSASLWGAHPHSTMDNLQPPGAGFIVSSLPRECARCVSGQALLGHCDRCGLGLTGQPYVMGCHTCDQLMNRAVGFCAACAAAGQAEHDRSHKFLFISVRLDVNNKTSAPKVTCLDCHKTGFTDIGNHPHPRIDITSGPLHMSELNGEARRDCPLAPVRSTDAYTPNGRWGSPAQRCSGCHTIFAVNHKVSQCMTCCYCFCQTCTVAGPGKTHPHALAKVTLRRTPAAFMPNVQRKCDTCRRVFKASEAHLRCDTCNEWDICAQCIGKHRQMASLNRGSQLHLGHRCSPNPAVAGAFSFYCPAPAVSAPRGTGGAAQGSRGVAGTGMTKTQMFNLALKGTKLALAVASVAMGGNNGGGGGGGFDASDFDFGGGGDSGFDPGFTMDMQADTWAPVDAMASDPVV